MKTINSPNLNMIKDCDVYKEFNLRKWFYLSLIITIILRLPFATIPIFIADEAELMTFGAQILNGSYYAMDVVSTRGPGGYYIIALFTYIFGFGNTLAFHLSGIGAQIIILFLIRQLGCLLLDKSQANLACLFYSVFSFSYILHDTLAFNVEVISLPFLLGSAILFYKGLKQAQKKLLGNAWLFMFIFSGFLCAIVFSIKQVIAGCLAVYVIMVCFCWANNAIHRKEAIKSIACLMVGFIGGFFLLFGPTLIVVGREYTIYWLALFSLNHYNPGWTGRIQNFIQRVILMFIGQPLEWTLTMFWMVFYLKSLFGISKNQWTNKKSQTFIFLMLLVQWFGALVAGHVVGHYFIPSFPFMAIMSADITMRSVNIVKENVIIPNNLLNIAYRYIGIGVFLVGIVPPVINYTLFPEGVQTPDYSINAFFKEKLFQKEDPINKCVSFICLNSSNKDRIFVLGRLYEVYTLARRLPASIALGLTLFEKKGEDSHLNATYNRIIKSLQKNPPKIIVLPCPDYRGIDLETGPWGEIRDLLQTRYGKPKRFSWQSRLRFLSGKQKLMENVEEWIDIYSLK